MYTTVIGFHPTGSRKRGTEPRYAGHAVSVTEERFERDICHGSVLCFFVRPLPEKHTTGGSHLGVDRQTLSYRQDFGAGTQALHPGNPAHP